MTQRQSDILAMLNASDFNAAELSFELGVPAPSVRRDVGILRGTGIAISTVGGRYSVERAMPASSVLDPQFGMSAF